MQRSHLARQVVRTLAAALITSIVGVANAYAEAQPTDGADAAVMDAFGIDAGTIVPLAVDRTPGVPVSVVVPFEGVKYTLDLVPHSVRADGFAFIVQSADGSSVERNPGPVGTLRGTVRGLEGSFVVGGMMKEGLVARVELPDGGVYWVEPVSSNLPDADPNLYVIYRTGESRSYDAARELALMASSGALVEAGETGFQSGYEGKHVAELGCDSDFEYFLRWGPDPADVSARIELLVNLVSVQFSRDVDIIHFITAIIVRSEEPDPYSGQNCILLGQFRAEWANNQQHIRRDVAFLFSGQLAFPSECYFPASVCTDFGFGVGATEFNNNRSCATDLLAHVLGHIWGAQHCSCPGWTMNTSISCANRFHPTVTVPDIIEHRDSRDCLDMLGPLELPFFEDFPEEFPNPFNWAEIEGVVIGGASNPPSPPWAAEFNRTDFMVSNVIDTSGVNPAAPLNFSFYTEERFAEGGDFFFAEYLNVNEDWQIVFSEEGNAHGNQDEFDFHEFPLPDDAKHTGFRIRLRTSCGVGDSWFVDDILVAAGDTEICIVHGNPDWDRDDPETWVSFNDWAFGGYICPKVESTDGVNLDLGLDTFNVVFTSEPFGDPDGGPVTPDNVSVEETGAGPAPNVIGVTENGNGLTVELDRIITLQEWTTVVFDVWDANGVRTVDSGNEGEGVDECARLDVGFLPGDVNNSGRGGQPLDLGRWIVAWNAGPPIPPPSGVGQGSAEDYLDISRNGLIQPQDLARLIALMKGQPPFTRNWRDARMNNTQP